MIFFRNIKILSRTKGKGCYLVSSRDDFFFFYWSVEEQERGKDLKVFSGATIIIDHEM